MPVLICLSPNSYATLKLNVSFENPVFSGPPNNSTFRLFTSVNLDSSHLVNVIFVSSKSLSCGFGILFIIH